MNMTKTVCAGASLALLLSSCVAPPYQGAASGYYGPPLAPPQGPEAGVYSPPVQGPETAPPGPTGPGPADYPVAERTGNPNHVISPYGPNYNVIDVTGFRSGALARDPSNNKIFRVP